MTVRTNDLNHGRVLAAAKEDHDAVIELTRALVRIPTRAGIDPYPIVDEHTVRFGGPPATSKAPKRPTTSPRW